MFFSLLIDQPSYAHLLMFKLFVSIPPSTRYMDKQILYYRHKVDF